MQKRSKSLKSGLALLGIFILISSSVTLFQENTSMVQVNDAESYFIPSYTTHSPIFIDTNNDFELQGYPGNGSLADPYLISGFNITTTGVCIRIQDTTAHFIIHDCILSGGTANNGIELSYVDNGVIRNNTIFEKNRGIYTNHASGVTIFNNTIFDSGVIGVYIYESSHYNTVANNTIVAHSNGQAVYVSQSCSNNVISNNTISGDLTGLSSGIAVLACVDNLIEFNTITDNAGHGVWVSGSYTTTLVNNTISSNGYGVGLYSADFSIIANNTLTDNDQGFKLSSSAENNTIYLNIIAYNNNNNAVDDGEDNKWNSTTWGNYWSDYIGTGFYNIPGSGSSIDYHPFSYDSKAPTIDHPEDVEYIEGSTGHSITWNATDFHPSHYEILDNETELISHSWSGELITVTIDGFNVGTHIVTIIVHDTFGYYSTDIVIVIVTAQATTSTTTTTTTATLPIDIPSFDTMTLLMIGGGIGIIMAVLVLMRSRRS
ncbi:MAG: nitrous oxide reductase family maturation protein NosD [Candidatus Thorarchaeota archaeon]